MRDRVGRRGFSRRIAPMLLVPLAALSLAGCDSFKRTVGIERTSPDEFAVESRAPLTIPPDFDLRPPQPGAPRPQEPSAADKAKLALDTAGPGDAGKQAKGNLVYPGTAGTGGPQGDPNAQFGANSLASRLLGYDGKGDGAISVDGRQTTLLQGVY